MIKPEAEAAIDGLSPSSRAAAFTLSSDLPVEIEKLPEPVAAPAPVAAAGKQRRRRRGSHTEIMVKPSAMEAVLNHTPTEPTGITLGSQVRQQNWARLYDSPALHKGDWFDYETVSGEQHRARESSANLDAVNAQIALTKLEQNMCDRGSFEGLRAHAIEESTRFPPAACNNRKELKDQLLEQLQQTASELPSVVQDSQLGESFQTQLSTAMRSAASTGWSSTTEAANFNKIVASNDILRVREVLDCGADPNAKDERGFTPLLQAVYLGDQWLPIINLLLKRGADKNMRDKQGRNALTLAKYLLHEKVTALLEKGQRTLYNFAMPSYAVNTV